MNLQIPVAADIFDAAIVTARGVPSDGPLVEGFPHARSTVYTAPETGAALGECCLWPDGSAFYYLEPSLVPEPVARDYLTEVANVMGCDTIEEMDEHEAWLASYREHAKSVRAGGE